MGEIILIMPYSASLIAAAFVDRSLKERNYLTQMKLQKMVYFAHGYHLAKFGTPLLEDAVQAWKFGPVIPQIYSDYKLYASDLIKDTRYISIPYKQLEKEFSSLSASAQDAINYTWEVTKYLSAAKLSNWTHETNSPWAKVYNPNDRETVISNDLIKQYFTTFLAAA